MPALAAGWLYQRTAAAAAAWYSNTQYGPLALTSTAATAATAAGYRGTR